VGCPKCEKLARHAEEAAKLAGVEATVERVTDMDVITGFGVMMTPALVIDAEVKSSGRIPQAAEIVSWLTTAAAKAG
jgi:small redox-active disulfide protein 2